MDYTLVTYWLAYLKDVADGRNDRTNGQTGRQGIPPTKKHR